MLNQVQHDGVLTGRELLLNSWARPACDRDGKHRGEATPKPSYLRRRLCVRTVP